MSTEQHKDAEGTGSRQVRAGSRSRTAHLEDIVDYFSGKGHSHPVSEAVQDIRRNLLDSGFDEINTSVFLQPKEVREISGNVYPVIKDSIFHLSWVRLRPVPFSTEMDVKFEKRFGSIDRAELWNLLDMVDEDSNVEMLLRSITEHLHVPEQDALAIINMVPELSAAVPRTGDLTLRSLLPTPWLQMVKTTFNEQTLPMTLFTITPAFTREPVPDQDKARNYHLLSIAVFDKGLTIEKGKGIMKRVLDLLNIEQVRMAERPHYLPYFEPGTEHVMTGGDLEIGTFGMVSKDVLKSHRTDCPVFVADICIERILMHKHHYPDIRGLLFPQFYSAWKLSDEEIASSVKYKHLPKTDFGKDIAKAVLEAYKEHGRRKDRSKVVVWRGLLVVSEFGRFLVADEKAVKLGLKGRSVEVVIKEAVKDLGLTGPAAFNEIWVKDGDIIGTPPSGRKEMMEQGAVMTKKDFLKAFSNLAAWKIERSLAAGQTGKNVEKIRVLEDINLRVSPKTLHYLLSYKKKVIVQGPVYLSFVFRERDPRTD